MMEQKIKEENIKNERSYLYQPLKNIFNQINTKIFFVEICHMRTK